MQSRVSPSSMAIFKALTAHLQHLHRISNFQAQHPLLNLTHHLNRHHILLIKTSNTDRPEHLTATINRPNNCTALRLLTHSMVTKDTKHHSTIIIHSQTDLRHMVAQGTRHNTTHIPHRYLPITRRQINIHHNQPTAGHSNPRIGTIRRRSRRLIALRRFSSQGSRNTILTSKGNSLELLDNSLSPSRVHNQIMDRETIK